MVKYCAIDGGNSTINIVIDGVVYPRVFPSIQSDALPAKESYNNAMYSKSMDTNLYNKLHVETTMFAGKDKYRSEFLFGKMAEEFQKELRTRSNSEKHQDKNLAKWMLTALAFSLLDTKIKNENYEIKENDVLQFNVVIGTGLPYREGKDIEKRKIWSSMFMGVHKVHFLHPIFKNLTVDLVVEDVLPWVEGEMALAYQLNKKDGIYLNTKDEELLNKKMGIIDIGGHTTEFVTLAYELEDRDNYDEYDVDLETEITVKPVVKGHLTDGVQRGVKTIMEDVITEIEEWYRVNVNKPLKRLTSRDIELAFTNKGRYNGEVGWIMPEKIDIKPFFNRHIENLAMDITQKIHILYQEHTISEIDYIFLCGGGSRIEHLVNMLKSELTRLGFNGDKIVSVDDPIFANAKGYYMPFPQIYEDALELE
ncbi:MAG: ParM/StbA family protein [Bacilli bacterium]|nr:ParM/StbA family protein [Bacilli bacterium]